MSMLKNWNEEKRSAFLYGLVAKSEPDNKYKKLFLELAEGAEKQAQIWQVNLEKEGELVPSSYQPDMRARLIGWLLSCVKPKQIRFILAAMKVRGMSIYSASPSGEIAISSHPEHRHRGINSAGNLRAAVFGVNDGLVSNASLLLGMVGANANHHFILLSGFAGLLAGACSMAAGEYISVRSQQEFFAYQIGLEKEELELYPEEEADELSAIYRARGLSDEDARYLAKKLVSNPATALDTLAREELGLNPNELGSPLGAAISSFLSFAAGAFIPVIPFLFGDFAWNITLSIGLSLTALAVIGALLSLFTNRSALLSGLRMLGIGLLAGSITYLLGTWMGRM